MRRHSHISDLFCDYGLLVGLQQQINEIIIDKLINRLLIDLLRALATNFIIDLLCLVIITPQSRRVVLVF